MTAPVRPQPLAAWPAPVSRRRLVSSALMLTGGAALLSACGGSAVTSAGTSAATSAATTAAVSTAPAQPTPGPTPTLVTAAPPTAVPVAKNATTIHVWWNTSNATLGIANDFMTQTPTIKVELSTLGDIVFGDQKFEAAVAAGTGPDVAFQNRHTFKQFASQNLYRPIDDYFGKSGLKKDDFFMVQLGEVTWLGKLYGLPYSTDARFLFWNKDLFKKAGLDPETPPTTWAELEQYTAKLTQKSGSNGYSQLGFIPYRVGNTWMWLYAWINKGQAMDPTGHQVLCDSAQWIDALTWVSSFYPKYLGGAGSATSFLRGFQGQATDPFGAGKLAMIGTVNNAIGTYAGLELNFGMAPFPVSPNGEKSTWSCGFSFAMPPSTKHTDQAWTFMQWVIGPAGFQSAGTTGLAQATQDWRRRKLPGTPVFVPQLATYKPSVAAMDKTFGANLDANVKPMYQLSKDALNWTHGCGELGIAALDYWNQVDRAAQAAIDQKSTPKDALQAAKAAVQTAVDQAWAKVPASK